MKNTSLVLQQGNSSVSQNRPPKALSYNPALLAELRRLQDENDFLKATMHNLEKSSDVVSDHNDRLRRQCLKHEARISELEAQLAAKPSLRLWLKNLVAGW